MAKPSLQTMASGEPAEEEENIVEGKLGQSEQYLLNFSFAIMLEDLCLPLTPQLHSSVFSEAEPFSNTAALNILSQVFQARNMDVVNAPERVRKTWDYLKQFNVQGNAANATALQGCDAGLPSLCLAFCT